MLEGYVVGFAGQQRFLGDHRFCQGATFLEAGETKHSIAHLKTRDVAAHRHDGAGEIHPHGPGEDPARDDLHLAAAQLPVDRIDGSEADFHSNFARAR
ncbi:hypothetical protein D3C76_849720 [compost metagenome]